MMIKIYPRCFLNTPALQINWLNKAKEFGAEVGIIDLEDSIPKNKKEQARICLNNFLNSKPSLTSGVRINSIRSSDGIKDILLLLSIPYPPDIVILPGVEFAEEVKIASDLFKNNNYKPKIFSVIESPKALININSIAEVSNGLIFGAADYSANMGVEITKENTMIARHLVATTAAAFETIAIDTPFFNINNPKELFDECKYAQKIGFHGKIAIHTSQVEIINSVFSPTEDQVRWAETILSTLEESDNSISKLDGIMIGPPFITLARKILADNCRNSNILQIKK